MSSSDVGKMLLSIFVGAIIKVSTYFAIVLVGSGLFWLLSKIPIISGIVNWIFGMRGDNPSIFVSILGLVLAFVLMRFLVAKICGGEKPFKYASIIIGALVIALHTVFLIMNIVAGGYVYVNIFNIVFGILCIVNSNNYYDAA